MDEEKKLKNTTVGLLLSTAVFFDALQWLMAFVLLDWAVTIFAYGTFWLWFTMIGVKLLTPKRFAAQTGTLLVEVIPFVAALPAITCMVTLTILDVRLKEKGISLEGMGKARAKEIRASNKAGFEKLEKLEKIKLTPPPPRKQPVPRPSTNVTERPFKKAA